MKLQFAMSPNAESPGWPTLQMFVGAILASVRINRRADPDYCFFAGPGFINGGFGKLKYRICSRLMTVRATDPKAGPGKASIQALVALQQHIHRKRRDWGNGPHTHDIATMPHINEQLLSVGFSSAFFLRPSAANLFLSVPTFCAVTYNRRSVIRSQRDDRFHQFTWFSRLSQIALIASA